MKYNLEEKLNKIKIKSLSLDEKNSVWSGFVYKKSKNLNKGLLSFNFKKNMIGALLSLILILGGGGVVAASNSSIPGDSLFGVDLAVERARIALASDEGKKNELKVKFAEERMSEAKTIIEKQGSAPIREIDLSDVEVTEIEVDVFTNETTVKIEAGDKHYGFVTAEKDRTKIIDEIKAKYKLTDEQINNVLSFETEDRSSQADDREFLNSDKSLSFKSEKQQREFEGSLSEVGDMVTNSNLSDEDKAKLSSALAGIMILLEENPNLDLEIKTKDGMKIEVEDGKIEIKTNNGKNDEKDGDKIKDVKENEDEIFCRGEWRDSEDCDDVIGGDDSDDDSNDDDGDDNGDDSDDDSDDNGDDNRGRGNSSNDDDEDAGEDDSSGDSSDDGDDDNGDDVEDDAEDEDDNN
ncbi:MAG: hypothetical protein QG654_19 [Patescibacteria group bacterium]|nr:hypothetical protein [Patescibacteria group bacterium]